MSNIKDKNVHHVSITTVRGNYSNSNYYEIRVVLRGGYAFDLRMPHSQYMTLWGMGFEYDHMHDLLKEVLLSYNE